MRPALLALALLAAAAPAPAQQPPAPAAPAPQAAQAANANQAAQAANANQAAQAANANQAAQAANANQAAQAANANQAAQAANANQAAQAADAAQAAAAALAGTGLVPARLVAAPGGARQLVLAPWPGLEWRVQQFQRLVEIRLSDTILAIDLGAVPRPAFGDGVVDVATDRQGADTLLRLVLGCDCRVDLAATDDGRLTLDIVPDDAAAADGARDARAPQAAPVPPRPVGRAAATNAAAATPPREPGALDVEAVRARLLAQLQRAAEAGLIELKPDYQPAPPAAGPDDPALALLGPAAAPGAEPAATPPGADTAAAPPGADPAAAPPASDEAAAPPADDTAAAPPGSDPAAAPPADEADAEGGARQDVRPAPKQSVIRPRRDPPKSATPAPAAPAAPAPVATVAAPRGPVDLLAPRPAPRCVEDAVLKLPDPTPADETVTEIARLNRALIGEFDRVDPAPAEALARLYLSRGLGAEALALLSDFAPDHAAAPALAALAELMEGRALAPGHALSAPGCGGVQTIWQAYAAALDGDAASALALEAKSGRAIEALPRRLRARLATRLGLTALDLGDQATARRLQALAGRSLPRGQDLAEIDLLDARLHQSAGAPDAALARLQRLRARPDDIGAEATLLIARMVADEQLPGALGSAHLRADLGALALDAAGTPLGIRAFDAEAELTARADGREAALDLLAFGLARGLTDQAGYVAAVRRIGTDGDAADETPLALLYDADPSRFLAALDEPSFRIALARSYADIGAPDLGAAMLRAPDLTQPEVVEALVRAWVSAGEIDTAATAIQPLAPGPVREGLEAMVAEARGAASALVALNEDATPGAAPDPAWTDRLAVLEERLSEAPGDADTATRAALLSASLGAPAMSPAAAKTLQGTDPALAARLATLFGGGNPASPPAAAPQTAAAEVPAYLQTIDDETKLFKELLNDG